MGGEGARCSQTTEKKYESGARLGKNDHFEGDADSFDHTNVLEAFGCKIGAEGLVLTIVKAWLGLRLHGTPRGLAEPEEAKGDGKGAKSAEAADA